MCNMRHCRAEQSGGCLVLVCLGNQSFSELKQTQASSFSLKNMTCAVR